MTNFEKIKAMSVEEMVDFLWGMSSCTHCKVEDCDGYSNNCILYLKKWLESEGDENAVD